MDTQIKMCGFGNSKRVHAAPPPPLPAPPAPVRNAMPRAAIGTPGLARELFTRPVPATVQKN